MVIHIILWRFFLFANHKINIDLLKRDKLYRKKNVITFVRVKWKIISGMSCPLKIQIFKEYKWHKNKISKFKGKLLMYARKF